VGKGHKNDTKLYVIDEINKIRLDMNLWQGFGTHMTIGFAVWW